MGQLEGAPDQSAVAILLMYMLLGAIVLGMVFVWLAGRWVRRKGDADRRAKHKNVH